MLNGKGSKSPGRVSGSPRAKGAFSPPTVPTGHDIGSGFVSKIGVIVAVELPFS